MVEVVRWNIKVSKKTDLTLRTFLGSKGMKKGDLSKFIEEAVRWRVFRLTTRDIKARTPVPTRRVCRPSSTRQSRMCVRISRQFRMDLDCARRSRAPRRSYLMLIGRTDFL
jgi:hypothetical protein